MRSNLAAYAQCQVFLNYPFDAEFSSLADAINFAVVAGGVLGRIEVFLTRPVRVACPVSHMGERDAADQMRDAGVQINPRWFIRHSRSG